MSKTNGIQVGQAATDFTLQDGDGAEWRLSDRRGRVVVLLFYPGDGDADLHQTVVFRA